MLVKKHLLIGNLVYISIVLSPSCVTLCLIAHYYGFNVSPKDSCTENLIPKFIY
jgi:hypothetical protein